MARKRISKKPEHLSVIKNPKKVATLRSGAPVFDWDPTAELLNETELAKALFECLKDEDIESFKEILSAHLDAKVKTRLAKEHGLSARTMFEALSINGNPSLKTIAKLVKLACAS